MKTYLYLLLFLPFSFLFGQSTKGLEIPFFGLKDTITYHTGYSVSYNHQFRQANWVAYQLTKSETSMLFSRQNKFISDPLIKGTDNAKDYEKSGYDRGHLAPAADMGFSKKTMAQSFYFSNMSPQLPSFNRGIWKKLEEQTRNWAIEYDSLYIVVGPIFSKGMKRIGSHHVAVPTAYYKVILDGHKGKEKMIGFILKNESSSQPLSSYVVSIDRVEGVTGIDFFSLLDDSLENRLEGMVGLNFWSWSAVEIK